MEAPIAVSNVALLDPKAEKPTPTRIRTGYLADGRKIRLSKRSGEETNVYSQICMNAHLHMQTKAHAAHTHMQTHTHTHTHTHSPK